MKKLAFIAMAGLVLFASSCSKSKYSKNATLEDKIDTVSYALGVLNGSTLTQSMKQNMPFEITDSTLWINMFVKFDLNKNFVNHFGNMLGGINEEAYKYGFYHICMYDKAQIDPTMADIILSTRANELEAKKDAERAELAAKSLEEGKKFLAENATKEGVITLKNGLQYKVEKMGEGKKPVLADQVKVHYTGKLLNGEVFDSSVDRGEPAVFPLDRVIKGWTEILQLMPVGSKWTVYIPSELAYGEYGGGDKIPGNATLIFDIELLEIVAPQELK